MDGFSSPLWMDSPSLGSHSSGLPSTRCCLLLGNLWDQFPDFNTPGGEHDQTFKKKSLHQEKKKQPWHVPYALSWHLDIKSATPNCAKNLPETPEIKFLSVPSSWLPEKSFLSLLLILPHKSFQRWSKHPISHLAALETMLQWVWNVWHFCLSGC